MPIPGISCMGVAGSGAGGLSIDFLGTTGNTPVSSPVTYSSVSLGEPSPDRVIIFCIMCNSSSDLVFSVTIGGVAASRLVTKSSTGTRSYIFAANVPSGTTGNIVIEFSLSPSFRFGWFRMVGTGGSVTPTNTGSTSVTSGDVSLFCTVPSQGAGVVVVADDAIGSHTPTNYIEAFDGSDGAGDDSATGGVFTATETLTCQNTTTNTDDKALCYASWGP